MKKIFLILFVSFSLSHNISAQVEFVIQELSINYIYSQSDTDIYVTTIGNNSPSINIQFLFKNNTDNIFTLNPLNSRIKLFYYYDEKEYMKQIDLGFYYTLFNDDPNEIVLQPGEEYKELQTTVEIFAETDLYKHSIKDFDYTEEFIRILPTIKVEYIEHKNNISLKTTEIKNVKIVSFNQQDLLR